ncbi:dual OB domain-containing protein [Marinobacter sp.]|uniref:dual OB domain-containing protein n=1 Tax=Marinobacter sp. TaxID=50741 RepID=UPI003B518382
MREVIITDLTRFSTDENVCTAVIDVNTGECLRPMPYLKSKRCKELGIHPGAILKGDLVLKPGSQNPHIEDSSYSNLQFHGACTSDQFRRVLYNSLSESVSDGFGVDFAEGQKHIPHDQLANCSIITVKIEPNKFSIHEDQYKPGKIKATFTDSSGRRYSYLSITDRGFHDYAKRHQDDGRLNEVAQLIEGQEDLYLRIGLSRVFQVPDGRNGYWLQVNGIYTFPDFHDEIRTYE